MSFAIHTREDRGATVLDLFGRLTLGGPSSELRDHVRALTRCGSRIVLNFAGVDYVDSGGLGDLVGCHALVRNGGGQLKLVNLHRRLDDLVRLTRLDSVFEICASVDSALGEEDCAAVA